MHSCRELASNEGVWAGRSLKEVIPTATAIAYTEESLKPER